jgi:hypothetical protein
MFTVLLDKHAAIWVRLLNLNFPQGAHLLDLPHGLGESAQAH